MIGVFSPGGSGLRFFKGYLSEFINLDKYPDPHVKEPPQQDLHDTFIFLYANIGCILNSFFARNVKREKRHRHGDEEWLIRHCKRLGGNWTQIKKGLTIDGYFSEGKDLLGLNEYFDNWLSCSNNIAYLKYEALTKPQVLEKIGRYIALKKHEYSAFVDGLAKRWVPRESKPLQNLYFYRELQEKLDLMPQYLTKHRYLKRNYSTIGIMPMREVLV